MAKEFMIEINPGRKIGDCCADPQSGSSTANVAVVPGALSGRPHAIATDGRKLAVVEVEGTAPEKPTLLPAAAMAANGKESIVGVTHEVRITSGKKKTVLELPDQFGLFPCVRSLLNSTIDPALKYRGVLINTKYLSQLAAAISSGSCVYLLVPEPKKEGDMASAPCVVLGHNSGEEDDPGPMGLGLIVPLSNSPTCVDKVQKVIDAAKVIASEIPEGKITFSD